MTSLKLDNYNDCCDIILFYSSGTASHFETAIIDAIKIADAAHRARIAVAFPVLVQAYMDSQTKN